MDAHGHDPALAMDANSAIDRNRIVDSSNAKGLDYGAKKFLFQCEDANKTAVDSALSHLRFLIPDRLAFVSGTTAQLVGIKKSLECCNIQLFTSDLHLKYDPFASDFGPVNLGIVHLFCKACSAKLARSNGIIVYCFDSSFASQANASFLLSAFMMLCHGQTAKQAAEPFACATAPFTLRPFRDATHTAQIYPLSLEDCLSGLAKAVKQGWYDMDNFDVAEYEALDNPEAGDMHQLCPKFVAFKGPLADNARRENDELAFPPAFYAPTLRRLGVTCVVRLNEPSTYDSAAFEAAGIRHHDLYFDDCTIPTDDVVERFLDICGAEPRVAIHCRAGLGRTGTLAALWLMKHAGFTANEAIGWLRIVRPGSVIGPQQLYLRHCERRQWAGNRLLRAPPRPPTAEAGLRAPGARHRSMPELSADLARQVTQGMCGRGVAKAAAAHAAAANAARPVSLPPAPGSASRQVAAGKSDPSAAAAAALRHDSASGFLSLPALVLRPPQAV